MQTRSVKPLQYGAMLALGVVVVAGIFAIWRNHRPGHGAGPVDLALREPEEQAATGKAATADIPEVEWRPAQGKPGFIVFEHDPLIMVAQGDLKKQPPPIIDFDPPNPPNGKDKKIPQVAPTPIAPAPAAPTVPLPGPRPLLPFGPRQARLPLLGDPALALAKLAPATKAELDQLNQYVKGLADPRHALELIQGRARLLMLKAAPKRIQVAVDGVITCTLVAASDVSIVGNQVGTTVMNVWFASAEDKTREAVVSYVVRVAPDPEAKERIERAYKALETEINQSFPRSQVRLKLVGDAIVIAGKALERREADLIQQVVAANIPGDERGRPRGSTAHARVVNMLQVPELPPPAAVPMPPPTVVPTPMPPPAAVPTPTVEIRKTPEEVCTELAKQINVAFPDSQVQLTPIGDVLVVSGHASHRREAAQLLRIVAGNACGLGCAPKVLNRLRISGAEQVMLKVVIAEVNRTAASRVSACFDLSRQTACMDSRDAGQALNILKHFHCATTLAEPNLVALDGEAAKFEVGCLASGPGASPFGVQLGLLPTILDTERIRLEVSASLGARDGVAPRGFSSTVEIREGQTLAVAGLIQSTLTAHRVPFLRGAVEEKELVILITPEFMHERTQVEIPSAPVDK